MIFEELENKITGHKPQIVELKRANAILVPLVDTKDGVCLLFETRSMTVWQPGEVCFPGGGIEPGETVEQAAIRECCEEIGVRPGDIEIISDFDTVVGLGGFVLYSCIGKLTAPAYKINTEEVAGVFTVPLDFFLNTEPKIFRFPMPPQIPEDFDYSVFGVKGPYPWRTAENTVYAWEYEGHHIWGLTAKIINQLRSYLTT